VAASHVIRVGTNGLPHDAQARWRSRVALASASLWYAQRDRQTRSPRTALTVDETEDE